MVPVARSAGDRRLVLALALGVIIGGSASGIGVLAAPPLDPGAHRPPTVSLTTPMLGPGWVAVDVAEAHPMLPLSEFSARLFQNGMANGTLEVLFDGAIDRALSFSDRGDDGRLSAGDRFVAFSPLPGTYELLIFYRGSLLVRSTWTL